MFNKKGGKTTYLNWEYRQTSYALEKMRRERKGTEELNMDYRDEYSIISAHSADLCIALPCLRRNVATWLKVTCSTTACLVQVCR